MAAKLRQNLDHARDTFEGALARIRSKEEGQASQPTIAARKRPIVPAKQDAATEKRSLTEAARALAQLWNVSPHLVR